MQEQWVQALGTLVTIAGLVVVAPYEAGRTLPDLGRAVLTGLHGVGGWLARWLPFFRRDVTANQGTAVGVLRLQGSARARVGLGEEGITPEEQLVRLRAAIVSIYGELDGLWLEISRTRADLAGRVDQLGQEHARLQEAVDRHRREQGEVNARGFPLAAAGALLAGVPWWFASWWWSPLFLLLAGGTARLLWESRDRLAAGWSAS